MTRITDAAGIETVRALHEGLVAKAVAAERKAVVELIRSSIEIVIEEASTSKGKFQKGMNYGGENALRIILKIIERGGHLT